MRWFRRRTRDFDDEIDAHLAIETDRLVAEGWNRDDAALAARRAFGNVTTVRERFYESRRLAWLDQIRQDLRAGARNLRRYPAAAAVAILSIAAGIAAMTCFLTLRNVIFENPPPLYSDPEQLSKIQVGPVDRPMLPIGRDVPFGILSAWRNIPDVSLSAATPPRAVRDIRTSEGPVTGPVRRVTPNFFSLLGVPAAIGRTFAPGLAGDAEAVLSHRLWELWFGGRRGALGSTIWIDDRAYTIVGVMPRQFWFGVFDPAVWTRLDSTTLRADDILQVVARRPEGMSHDSLEARLEGSVREHSRARGGTPLQLRASAVKGTPFGDMMSLILPFVFGASVLLTLLIACANVAILIIAQWTTRERETAVRAALGASRWRVVRALLAESIVLAGIAGVLGVGATFALRAILIGRSNPEFLNLAIDPSIFWQAALITILTGVAAGLGPALFETRRLQLDPLRGLATSDRVRQRWSHTLVVIEITVTLALLVVTTSMVDAYQRGRDADFGFDPDAYVVGSVNGISVPAGEVVETLRSIPGVEAAAAATGAPFAGRGPSQPLAADAAGTTAVRAERLDVSTGFFETLGLRVYAGRTFTAADEGTRGVAIINQTAALQLFGGPGVGRQVWVNGSPHDVIGVVADYASTPIEQRLPMPKVFVPLPASSRVSTFLRFVVRGADPVALVQPVRRALEDASPVDVIGTYTFRQVLDVQGQEMLLGTAPFLPLIVIGLLLTSSGVYGVLAFAIARRSRELAVRVAIGAGPRDQVGLVIARSARLVGVGLLFGVCVTFGLSRVVRAVGGAGSLYDPPWHAFVIPVAIVIAVGAVATWLPTRRVLRINPARLLAN